MKWNQDYRIIVLCSLLLSTISPSFAKRQAKRSSPLLQRVVKQGEIMINSVQMKQILEDEVAPFVSGSIAFYATMGLSTTLQKAVGISTGTKAMARVVGIPTVCIASLVSERTIRVTKCCIQNSDSMEAFCNPRLRKIKDNDFYELLLWNNRKLKLPKDDVKACIVGIGAFKMLGGRFWAIAPSSYASPGSFARRTLPATEGYISSGSKKRKELERIYEKWGCHACGSKVKSPIGDHNPPVSIGKLQKNPSYRFLPHCEPCSNRQGGIMSEAVSRMKGHWPKWKKIRHLKAAGGGSNALNHGRVFRVNHLTGGIILYRKKLI